MACCIETINTSGQSVVVNFSYSMNLNTLKGRDTITEIFRGMIALSHAVFSKPGRSMYVIYQNPVGGHVMVNNWKKLCDRLSDHFECTKISEGNKDYGREYPVHHDVISLTKKS